MGSAWSAGPIIITARFHRSEQAQSWTVGQTNVAGPDPFPNGRCVVSGPKGQRRRGASFRDEKEFSVARARADGLTQTVSVDPSESALPGAQLAYWVLTARRLREEVMGGELFSDPAWDILLDLYTALARGVRVKTSSVSTIAGVPPSTGRRWVSKLIDLGLVERAKELPDQRFTCLALSAKGRDIMEAFMIRLAGKGTPPLIR